MNTYDTIEKKNLCIKCGMCSSVCTSKALKTVYNDKSGFYRIRLDQDKCNNCQMCLKICPAQNNFKNPSSHLLGLYKRIVLGHSLNYMVRKNATSGGCINALIRYLIHEDRVDNVLMVCENNKKVIGTSFCIINKKNVDILEKKPRIFASRYVSYPILSAFKLLPKEGRIAVVGTPCQIIALSNYNKLLKSRDIFKIGIACSGGISYRATEYLLQVNKKPSGSRVYYRGNGWPGKNTIISDNTETNENHLESFFADIYTSQIFRNPACLHCNDQFADESDISFFDYWNHKEIAKERIGNSGIIIRSNRAEDYINDMVEKGYTFIEQELNEKNVVETQEWPIFLKKTNINNKFLVSIYFKFVHFIYLSKMYKILTKKTYSILSKLFLHLIK